MVESLPRFSGSSHIGEDLGCLGSDTNETFLI